MSRTLFAIGILFGVAATTEAQFDIRDFERVLVPVVARQRPGAFQSVWTTELLVRHEADGNLVFGYDTGDDPVILAPDATYSPRLYERLAGEPEGALIYIHRRTADVTHFALRVSDVSRNSVSAGVSVPVVRESQLLSGRAFLLGVPAGTAFRRMLRIYEPVPTGATTFRVRFYDDHFNGLIHAGDVSLVPSTRTLSIPGLSVPMRPASVEIDLNQFFPAFSQYDSISVEVEPTGENQKWWAFVALTNNVTQEVTLVVP